MVHRRSWRVKQSSCLTSRRKNLTPPPSDPRGGHHPPLVHNAGLRSPGRWTGSPDLSAFSLDELSGSTVGAAKALLGAVLVSDESPKPTMGVVVETEAYIGSGDPASHARASTGRTPRNSAMFGPAGHAYVYRIYGVHHCVNVVTGAKGDGLAVLIRALHPLEGHATMAQRRGRDQDLCNGPGRLSQALGITRVLDGHPLDRPPLRLLKGWTVPLTQIGTSGRIGIRYGRDWPLRFFVSGDDCVSKGKTAEGRHSADFSAALEHMERA